MARIVYNSISVGQIDAFALSRGYQANIADPANPGQTMPNSQTKLEFMEAAGRAFFEGECARGKKLQREVSRLAEDVADKATVIIPPGVVTP